MIVNKLLVKIVSYLGLMVSACCWVLFIVVFFDGSGISKKTDITVLGINEYSTDSLAIAENSGNVVDLEEKKEVDGEILEGDARKLLIRKYLEVYKSPLLPYADTIYEISKTYNIDYYWLLAIGQQESNLCKKIPEGSYNCWGYGIHKKGTLTFDNYELAIKSFAEYFRREYLDKGLNTPELVMKKYCPHSNGSWAVGVSQFIDEIKGGDFWVYL